MKKIISFVLAFAAMMGTAVLCAADDLSYQEKYEALLEHGVPEENLVLLEDKVDILYDDIFVQGYDYEWDYQEVTKEFDEKNPLSRGKIDTSKLQLNIGIASKVETIDQERQIFRILKQLTHIKWRWRKTPFMHNEDALSLNWDHTIYTMTSYSFEIKLFPANSGVGESVSKSYQPAHAVQGGVADYIPMRGAPGYQYGGNMEINMIPNSPMYSVNGGNHNTQFNAEYAHDGNPLGIPGSIQINATPNLGISLNGDTFTDYLAAFLNQPYCWEDEV